MPKKKNLDHWLPVPSPKHVEEFAEICKEQFGMELSSEDAFDTASRLLRIHFILKYVYIPPDRGIHPAPEDERENKRGMRKTPETGYKTLRVPMCGIDNLKM